MGNDHMMMKPLHPCPCCAEPAMRQRGGFEICPLCLWEDDPAQSDDPDDAEGGNGVSLVEARKLWALRRSL
jgi:hypothetical protein